MFEVRRWVLASACLLWTADIAVAEDSIAAGAEADTSATTEADQEEDSSAEEKPGRGDFDAGGGVRFPSGPDESNEFGAFNWIALDLEGRYFILDSVTLSGEVPLAVVKPDLMGVEPHTFGGTVVTLEMVVPGMSIFEGSRVGVGVSGAYMREGAMLLSERDYPLFLGDLQPGGAVGPILVLTASEMIDVSTEPTVLYQAGDSESITAVQVPLSAIVKLGSLLAVSADAGLFTGDDFALDGEDGGRLALGGSVTVRLGHIQLHTGAGAASLLTGGVYPSVTDSIYLDLSAKYVK